MMLCSKNGALHNPSTALFCTITALCLSETLRLAGVFLTSDSVGYQTKTTVAGQNFVTPTFKNVTGDKISIQDIKLSGDNVAEYIDAIYILDEYGTPKEGMTFYWTADGWIDDQSEPATISVASGEGVVVNTMMADVAVMFSGEVNTKDLQLISIVGQNFIGNASPVEIEVQDITLTGENVMEYIDAIYILDEYGSPKEGKTFYWTADGWIDDQSEPATIKLAAGDGFVVNTMMAGVEINLPGVEL